MYSKEENLFPPTEFFTDIDDDNQPPIILDIQVSKLPIPLHPIEEKLHSQLSNYPSLEHEYGVSHLSAEGIDELFKGVEDHAKKYMQKSLPLDYYRSQFIKYAVKLAAIEKTNYQGDEEVRKNAPEKAITSAEKLLGKKGTKLYQNALKEEVNSIQYRTAVFNKATKFIAGERWQKSYFIIISGPSGSGKSFATNLILQTVNKLPQKIRENNEGNLIICIDGAICREVSQMRKLAIRLANKKGYSGIEDLHEQSSILETAKERLKAATIKDNNFSIVMPETYSYWASPFKASDYRKFMIHMTKSERQVIFGKVIGHHESNFENVVCHYLGPRRAWKTEGFDVVELDLNSTEDLTESKAHVTSGFYFGKSGSDSASEAYEAIQKNYKKPVLRLDVVNDLILLRKEKENPETWVPAKLGDEDIYLASQYTCNQWRESQAPMGLREYSAANPHTIIIPSPAFQKLLLNEGATTPSTKHRFFSKKDDPDSGNKHSPAKLNY
ncbi:Uncharacterised protein [Legionella beliardensis]|uniref:Uncharacterized protein n=1 Tax=Legionella beliardensis TaxID=91822 RepID=A0A378IBJ7_9GAMM|nr:hypothetical protein [Legionella beliardensis]STX29674.1 Uncharacterised protein [Legionella beliardensis]